MSDSKSSSAPREPLFTLQLGTNGGTFAPTTAKELYDWIEIEYGFWSWIASVHPGNHANGLHGSIALLGQALNHAGQAKTDELTSPDSSHQYVTHAKNLLSEAIYTRGLPHSSTALAKRVEKMRLEDPAAALTYLFVMTPSQGQQFEPHNLSIWGGFIEGILEKFSLSNPNKKSFESLKQSAKELLAKSDESISAQTVKIGELHRNYEVVCEKINAESNAQNSDFVELTRFVEKTHLTMQESHAALLVEHQGALTNLQKVFKESMALRAPVQYWESRKNHHDSRTKITGVLAFGSLAALAIALICAGNWVLGNLGISGKPDTWRISFMVILAVLGIWAVRLVVRIFLSHIHLGTDAAERVTMVQTYLSLLEGENLPSDDDRKLILAALFRPASDGLVKDEGLPNAFLEMLTRPGK